MYDAGYLVQQSIQFVFLKFRLIYNIDNFKNSRKSKRRTAWEKATENQKKEKYGVIRSAGFGPEREVQKEKRSPKHNAGSCADVFSMTFSFKHLNCMRQQGNQKAGAESSAFH